MFDALKNLDLQVITGATTFTAAHDWAQALVYIAAQVLILIFPIILYLLWRWPEKDAYHFAAKKSVLIALVSIVIALAVKSVIGFLYFRARPFVSHPELLTMSFRVDPGSFPSGHSLIAFATAVSLYLSGYRRMGLILIGMAFLIALARVCAGVHYPSDVVAGALIGTLTSWYLHREASSLKRYLPNH